MKQRAHGDVSVGADKRLRLDAEGADLSTREEHHVRRCALQLVGARRTGRYVNGGGLEDDELRPDVQCGVGRGHFGR